MPDRRVDAEADGPTLAGQREEVFDGDRQTGIDDQGLRHVADSPVAAPVRDDAAVERDLAEQRHEERGLARAVRPDDRVHGAAADAQGDAGQQLFPVTVDRDVDDLDER